MIHAWVCSLGKDLFHGHGTDHCQCYKKSFSTTLSSYYYCSSYQSMIRKLFFALYGLLNTSDKYSNFPAPWTVRLKLNVDEFSKSWRAIVLHSLQIPHSCHWSSALLLLKDFSIAGSVDRQHIKGYIIPITAVLARRLISNLQIFKMFDNHGFMISEV